VITGANGAALEPNYTLFGMVTDGLDTTVPALDAAGNPENNGVPPLEPVTIESITITEGPAGSASAGDSSDDSAGDGSSSDTSGDTSGGSTSE
jgi:hypothetical protein